MGQIGPQPRLLTAWRISFSLSMVIPAFLIAILFHTSAAAPWLTGAWIAVFLAGYLVYLPLYYQRLSFSMANERILLYSGVLYTHVRCIPLRSIQFTTIGRSPLDYILGLCSLIVTAAGGRIVLPGLRPQDAEELSQALLEYRSHL